MMKNVFNLEYWMNLIGGKPPPANVIYSRSDDLFEASQTRGTLIIGDPSSGKSKYAAMQIFKKFKKYPRQAIFVFDWSGPLTNDILDLISRDPDYENLLKRVVLDELGNPDRVIPMPEFHPDYGLTE